MPAPMIAPIPSSTRFTGPSARLRLVRFDLGLEGGHSFRRNRLMRTSALQVSEDGRGTTPASGHDDG